MPNGPFQFNDNKRYNCGLEVPPKKERLITVVGGDVFRMNGEAVGKAPVKLNGRSVTCDYHVGVNNAMRMINALYNGRITIVHKRGGLTVYKNGVEAHRHNEVRSMYQMFDILYQHFGIIIHLPNDNDYNINDIKRILYPNMN